jgi:hypothetical protein
MSSATTFMADPRQRQHWERNGRSTALLMPSSTRDDAEHWRRRAAEMRAVAKDVLDPSKQTMLEIALGYERLAQRADERQGSKKK